MKVTNTNYTRPGYDNQDDALALWDHLYGDLEGYLCIAHAQRLYDDKGMPITKPTKEQRKEEQFREKFFRYPEEREEAIRYALKKNEEGREVWFCKHLLTDEIRQKEYSTEILTLGTEYDGAPLPNSNLAPTLWVESSPDHYHSYQRLIKPIDPEKAENLNERLCRETNGDKWYLTSLLRVPNTRNYKYTPHAKRFTESPIVTLKEIKGSDSYYDPDELDRILDPVEEKTRTKKNRKKKDYKPYEGDGKPPVPLNDIELGLDATLEN